MQWRMCSSKLLWLDEPYAGFDWDTLVDQRSVAMQGPSEPNCRRSRRGAAPPDPAIANPCVIDDNPGGLARSVATQALERTGDDATRLAVMGTPKG